MPLRFMTSGESHGPALLAILDGMPAGLPVTAQAINAELMRRQQGYGAGGVHHIGAFEQTFDPAFARRQQAKHQGAVR